MPTRLASHGIAVLRRLRSRMMDLPSRRLLRQFNFELERSQQATDRVDLVAHSGQLSYRAWRCWRTRAGARSERGRCSQPRGKGALGTLHRRTSLPASRRRDGLLMHDGVDKAAHGGHSKERGRLEADPLQSGPLATTCQQHRPPAMHGRPTSRPPARVRASK
jgi:hypothetical protein